MADREGEAASCRVQAEAILSGQSELLAQSGQLSEAIAAHKAELAAIDANREGRCAVPPICERWQRSCPVTEARRRQALPSISGRLRRLRPRSASGERNRHS